MFVTIISVIFVAAGAVLSFLATKHTIKRGAFLRDSEVTTGTIVALNESREDDETSYFPTVRFRTADGREVTFRSETASSRTSWQVGQEIRVRYRRDQPAIAEVDSFIALWGLPILLDLLGIVFLVIGVGILTGWIPVSAPAR